MLSLPTLPTDNFYKFLTYLGLLFTVLFFVENYQLVNEWKAYNQTWSDLHSKVVVNTEQQVNTSNEILVYRYKIVRDFDTLRDLSQVESLLRNTLKSEMANDTFRAINSYTRDALYDNIQSKLSFTDTTAEQRTKRISLLLDKSDALILEGQVLRIQFNNLTKPVDHPLGSGWILVLGMVLMTFGYAVWFVKHQLKLDKLLDLQIQELKNKIATSAPFPATVSPSPHSAPPLPSSGNTNVPQPANAAP